LIIQKKWEPNIFKNLLKFVDDYWLFIHKPFSNWLKVKSIKNVKDDYFLLQIICRKSTVQYRHLWFVVFLLYSFNLMIFMCVLRLQKNINIKISYLLGSTRSLTTKRNCCYGFFKCYWKVKFSSRSWYFREYFGDSNFLVHWDR